MPRFQPLLSGEKTAKKLCHRELANPTGRDDVVLPESRWALSLSAESFLFLLSRKIEHGLGLSRHDVPAQPPSARLLGT